jgi:hypothetical protein
MTDSLSVDFAALDVKDSSAPCPDRDSQVDLTDDAAVFLNIRGSKVPVSQEIISKVPFLETLFSGRIPSQQDADDNFKLDLDPVVLPAIFKYVTTGHCQYLLTALPTTASSSSSSSSGAMDPASIFKTLDYLCVDLQLPSLSDVDAALKLVRWEEGREEHSSRVKARDAAVQLMLGISNGTFAVSTHADSNKLFNMVLFIVSHPGTFYKRLRHWANAIAQQYLTAMTAKQRALLAEWMAKCAATWDNHDGPDDSGTDDSRGSSLYDCSDSSLLDWFDY